MPLGGETNRHGVKGNESNVELKEIKVKTTETGDEGEELETKGTGDNTKEEKRFGNFCGFVHC